MVFAEAQAIQKSRRLLAFQRGMRKQSGDGQSVEVNKKIKAKRRQGLDLEWEDCEQKSRLGRDEYTIEMRL